MYGNSFEGAFVAMLFIAAIIGAAICGLIVWLISSWPWLMSIIHSWSAP